MSTETWLVFLMTSLYESVQCLKKTKLALFSLVGNTPLHILSLILSAGLRWKTSWYSCWIDVLVQPFAFYDVSQQKPDGINISVEVFRGQHGKHFQYISSEWSISKINWHSHYIRVEKCQRCFWQKLFLSLHFWHLWHGPHNMLDSEQFQPKRIINVSI